MTRIAAHTESVAAMITVDEALRVSGAELPSVVSEDRSF